MPDKNKVLEELKKQLINRLKETEEKNKKDIKKSILETEKLEKSFDVGTIRTWKGQEYIKIAPNKWKPYYRGNSRGAKLAASYIAKQIIAAKDIDELMQIVSQNMARFGFSADGNDELFKKLQDAQKTWGSNNKKNNVPENSNRSNGEAKTNKTSISSEKSNTDSLKNIRDKYNNGPSVEGWEDTINVNGEELEGKWKIVEADAPTASHDETTFKPVKELMKDGSTINDRDYEKDKDAQESVMNMGADFDSRALDFGSPVVVTTDGVVISGNNRTMSSKIAAKKGTDKKYLEALKKKSRMAGIDAKELEKFKNPRLVFEVEHKGEYTTEEFAKFNKNGKKTMNTTEKAVKIAKTINQETVSGIAGVMNDYDTMAEMWQDKNAAEKVINSLINGGVIGKNEVSQYYTSEAGISESGKEFVETVLIGSVMNENNIRSLAGAGGKSIRQKLVRGIVPLIDNKGLGNEYSFNNELNEAVRIATTVMKDHEHFSGIKDFLEQENMFEEKPSAITAKLADIIYSESQKEFATKMRGLNAGLRPAANGEMNIFLGRCETRDEVINEFLKIKTAVKKALEFLWHNIVY